MVHRSLENLGEPEKSQEIPLPTSSMNYVVDKPLSSVVFQSVCISYRFLLHAVFLLVSRKRPTVLRLFELKFMIYGTGKLLDFNVKAIWVQRFLKVWVLKFPKYFLAGIQLHALKSTRRHFFIIFFIFVYIFIFCGFILRKKGLAKHFD